MAWIAGLFQSEANFGLDSRSKTRYKISTAPASFFIKISMVDQDGIEKVAKLVNKSCFSPSRKTSTGKTVYVVHIGDRATLSYLLPFLLPHLGERRHKSVQECLDALNAYCGIPQESVKKWQNKVLRLKKNLWHLSQTI